MENEAYKAVKEIIAFMKDGLETSNMPREDRIEFITNLDSLSILNEILEKFNRRGLCQFAHHVTVIMYLMLTNQPLLDEVVLKTKDVIEKSGDYSIKNKLH